MFRPAAFFAGGDNQTAAELANMKGQMAVVEQPPLQRNVASSFRESRPPESVRRLVELGRKAEVTHRKSQRELCFTQTGYGMSP